MGYQVKVVTSNAGATFSDCQRYRYLLWRMWNGDLPTVNFLMLNPSTATDVVLDSTVTRCMRRAQSWGYGSLIVTNLFALRSTDPRELYKTDDPVGPWNDQAIYDAAIESDMVLCAWGDHGLHKGRSKAVREIVTQGRMFDKLRCLKINKSGEPSHPLYLSYNVKPQVWPGRI